MNVEEFRHFSFNFTIRKRYALLHLEDNVRDENSGKYFLKTYDVKVTLTYPISDFIWWISFRNPEKYSEMLNKTFNTFQDCIDYFPNSNLKDYIKEAENAERKGIAEQI